MRFRVACATMAMLVLSGCGKAIQDAESGAIDGVGNHPVGSLRPHGEGERPAPGRRNAGRASTARMLARVALG